MSKPFEIMSVVLKTSEAQRKANKKYYNKNIDERKANLKQYYEANKEIIKDKRRKRYALQKQKKCKYVREGELAPPPIFCFT